MKQVRIYFTLSEEIGLLYVQVQTLQQSLTVIRLQYNCEICYATKFNLLSYSIIARNI